MAKICLQCRYFYHGHGKKRSLCTNRHSEKFPDKLKQDGHSSVCKHFRPPKHHHGPSLPDQFKSKLHFIESLRNNYKGRRFWVFATGPSLDDIPKNFLQVDEEIDCDPPVPKVCIAVKEAAIPFQDCTYNIWPFRDYALRRMYLPRGQIPPNFKKFIFTLRGKDRDNFFGEQSLNATFLRYTPGGTVERMKTMCESIIAGNSSVYYGIGTVTHLAIAAALVMGASKVSLVGCDHGSVDGKLRFQRGITEGYGWKRVNMEGYGPMNVGTNFLADFFRDHKIEIVRYYHGRGYEPIGKAAEEG